jgi:hypothetical protein
MSFIGKHVSIKDIKDAVLAASILLVFVLLVSLLINLRYRLSYDQRWKDIQKLLAKKSNWSEAIIRADKLLDDVLKKRHFKGKTMGERLVAAQHEISANDKVWYSHKLRNKLDSGNIKLTKTDVKETLIGYWLACKDLGAFKKDDK